MSIPVENGKDKPMCIRPSYANLLFFLPFHTPVFDVILRPTDATVTTQDARGADQTRIKESMGKVKAEIFDELSKPYFPRRPGQDTPRVFNFTCHEDRDVFFQRLRDRYIRLRNCPVFIQTNNNGVSG